MSILSKIQTVFTYRVYRLSDNQITDIDYSKLLPEKTLSKMSRNEFRCYVKHYLTQKRKIDVSETMLIKKVDRRIRNKETVRKLKMKNRNEFMALRREYEEMYEQYRRMIEVNYALIKTVEECQCQIDVKKYKEQLDKCQYKFVDIEY